MKPLFTQSEFDVAASTTCRLLLECEQCHKPFKKLKHEIQKALAGHESTKCRFCSRECGFKAKVRLIEYLCLQCGDVCLKRPKEISATGKVFCSQSCAATYNNQHKTTGTRRSKLEDHIEQQIRAAFPDVEIQCNRTDAIKAELDVYLPSLKLAFELNGIFHYEPIYGPEKLASTKTNDERKFQACHERGIELCVIDTSSMKKFSDKRAKQYVDIVLEIIRKKGARPGLNRLP